MCLESMNLETWYGECHPKSAFIDLSFIKSHVVGAEKRVFYKRGRIFPTIVTGWVALNLLSSSSQTDNSTPKVSFGIAGRWLSE